MQPSEKTDLCVSVFKNGRRTTTKREVTKMWVELINKVEKGKRLHWDGK